MKAGDVPLSMRYVVLSQLTGRGYPEGHSASQLRLERVIGEVTGCGAIFPLHKKTIRAIIDVPTLGLRTVPLLFLISRHVPALANNASLAVLLDDLGDVQVDELERCSYLVERLLNAGVQVLVVEPSGAVTSLAALRELVTTSDHIRIYLTDLWHQTRRSRRQRHPSNAEPVCAH